MVFILSANWTHIEVMYNPIIYFANAEAYITHEGVYYFTICADDFPVPDSKNSQSNGQQGVYMYHQIIFPKVCL